MELPITTNSSDLSAAPPPPANNISCFEYLKIAIVNLIKTLFRSIIAFFDSCFHNLFSLKGKNGQYHKYDGGKVFELKKESEALVGLVGYSKKTVKTPIEDLARDTASIVSLHIGRSVAAVANIVLIGHSMGGSVALEAARLLQENNMQVRVISIFSPHEGSNLLKFQTYKNNILHRNFHPSSPSLHDSRRSIVDLTRVVAAKDHVIPRTKEEIEGLKDAGCYVTDDGHSTFAINSKTIALIKRLVFSEDKAHPTHIFCLHGLNGTLGGMYAIARALNL